MATIGIAALCKGVLIVAGATLLAVPRHCSRVVLLRSWGPFGEELLHLFDFFCKRLLMWCRSRRRACAAVHQIVVFVFFAARLADSGNLGLGVLAFAFSRALALVHCAEVCKFLLQGIDISL